MLFLGNLKSIQRFRDRGSPLKWSQRCLRQSNMNATARRKFLQLSDGRPRFPQAISPGSHAAPKCQPEALSSPSRPPTGSLFHDANGMSIRVGAASALCPP
jgi:hypothetical protein